jgi:hypothetical protein
MKRLLVVSTYLAAGAIALHAAPVTVYTTVEDFSTPASSSGWSGDVAAPSTAWDFDGSAVNGAANANPGGTGTAGSLAITPTGSSLGWTSLGELYIGNFDSARIALDPGYAAGHFPAVQGTITMVYTVPDNAGGGAGTYYEPMLGFNAGWGWNLGGPNSTEYLGTIGGFETYRGTWSYSIPDCDPWGANLMIGANTDYAPIETFYVDDIIVNAPEPGTMSLLALGAAALLARRSANRR